MFLNINLSRDQLRELIESYGFSNVPCFLTIKENHVGCFDLNSDGSCKATLSFEKKETPTNA